MRTRIPMTSQERLLSYKVRTEEKRGRDGHLIFSLILLFPNSEVAKKQRAIPSIARPAASGRLQNFRAGNKGIAATVSAFEPRRFFSDIGEEEDADEPLITGLGAGARDEEEEEDVPVDEWPEGSARYESFSPSPSGLPFSLSLLKPLPVPNQSYLQT